MDRASEVGEGLFSPVLGELVVVVVGQVVDGGIDQERLGQVQAHPEAAGVHGRLQHRPGRRGAVLVAAQQFGCAGQVPGHPPIGVGAGEGVTAHGASGVKASGTVRVRPASSSRIRLCGSGCPGAGRAV